MNYIDRSQVWRIFESLRAGPKSPIVTEKAVYSDLAGSASDTDSLLEAGSESSFHTEKRALTGSWRYRAVTTFIFALVNLAFLVSIWFYPSGGRPVSVADQIFPQPEYETVIFHDDHIAPGPETDRIWQEELPHGHGFTIIDDPDYYRLPPGVAYADGTKKYGVSWAHQYHCVWMLRDAFWDLINNKSELVNTEIHEKSKEGAELWHLAHCFGYLRQHIICNMDMSLEWPTLEGPNAGIINGYEIPHTCKKREPLDAFMDAHGPDPALLVDQKRPTPPSHQHIIEGSAAA